MKTFRTLSIVVVVAAMLLSIFPSDVLSQRRGGSFGGSRSSGRSFSAPRSGGSRSFGGTRQSTPYGSRSTSRPGSSSMPRSSTTTRNSFGGSRLNSGSDYTSRYGTPRRTETTRIAGAGGTSTNYTVHRYGGMGDGFMMGYMMGAIPWYYSMPFHPAFYFSRPYTTLNPDGSTAVYPGTFQWGTLFFILLLVVGGGYILYVWMRSKRKRHLAGGVDMSRSSFS